MASRFGVAALVLAPLPLPASASDAPAITIGASVRASVTSNRSQAPNTGSDTSFNLDSIRLSAAVRFPKAVGAVVKLERNDNGDVNIAEGYVHMEPDDRFNIWLGRIVPPSDRSNLAGSYYISSYNYPGTVSRYPAKILGRDDGVAIWGKVFDRKLVYSAGLFKGHNRVAGASNQDGHPLVAARITYNFWDVEEGPGYYTSSTYYGAANLLTLAVAGQYQKNGVGTASARGDFRGWSVDGLVERKVLDGGAVTLEGAYYDYNTGGVADVAAQFGGASPIANVGGIVEGHGYLVSGAILFPTRIGSGKFQPVVRYQRFDASLTGVGSKQIDASLNYIIKGHNARLSLGYMHKSATAMPDHDKVTLGLQLRY